MKIKQTTRMISFSLILCITFLLTGNSFAPTATQSESVASSVATASVKSDIYWIINAHSGKALTVYNSGTTAGTNVIQSDNANGANQRWEVNTIYNPTYTNQEYSIIVPVCAYGKYLSVANTTLSNGTNVQIDSSGTAKSSHWDITKLGTNDNYKITSKCNSSYALTVENASLNNNANVFAY